MTVGRPVSVHLASWGLHGRLPLRAATRYHRGMIDTPPPLAPELGATLPSPDPARRVEPLRTHPIPRLGSKCQRRDGSVAASRGIMRCYRSIRWTRWRGLGRFASVAAYAETGRPNSRAALSWPTWRRTAASKPAARKALTPQSRKRSWMG